jgi:hypothetical protein
MAVYYMGEDITKSKKISGRSGLVSEYKDLIDQYLDQGGKITYCPFGRRSTDDDWERVRVKMLEEDFEQKGRENYGQSLFDMCKVDTYPVDESSSLDDPETVKGGF